MTMRAIFIFMARSCIYLIRLFKKPKLIKFVIPWIVTNLSLNRKTLKDEIPWITFEAKEWLDKFLKQDMTVFEYGSGGSTLFFSKKVKNLISIEHDKTWYEALSSLLKEKKILNCEYWLLEPRPILAKDTNLNFSYPLSFTSEAYTNMSFKKYVKSIDVFPNGSFDLILVDGRARPSCILHALNKLRPGGFLMLDDSERTYYHLGKQLIDRWERIDFFGPGPYDSYF